MQYLDGRDSDNTIEIHYSQNNSMSEWTKRRETDFDAVMKEIGDLGYSDMWIQTQIDWSIDSQDDWHVNDYWLTDGYDKDYHMRLGDWAYISQSYSSETAMSEWIFRSMGNIDDKEDGVWYGRHSDSEDYDGWKDVLKEDQYDVVKGDGESHAKIDLTKHTIYTRVRWLVIARTEEKDIPVVSDWSEIAAVGKEAEKIEPLKPGDVAAPVISDLKYTDKDFNGFPVVSFKLDVDDTLAKQVAQVTGSSGGISLIVEAKVQGKDEWVELQGDWIITAGTMESALQNLAQAEGKIEKDTPIELRAKYVCAQPDLEDFSSEYSEVLTFGSQEMEVKPEAPADEASVEESEAPAAESSVQSEAPAEKKCSLCGFCPQPLGLCIFIWIAVAVAVIIIVIVIIVVVKKKSDKKSE